MTLVADWIDRGVAAAGKGDEQALAAVRAEVGDLLGAFPAPGLPV